MVKLYAYSAAHTTQIDMIRAIFFSIIPPTIIFFVVPEANYRWCAGSAVKVRIA